MEHAAHRQLSKTEIQVLESRNCHADDWSKILVGDPFDTDRLYGVIFHGEARLGRLDGRVKTETGKSRRAGIYRATIENVTFGDNVLVNQISGYIANYDIQSGAIIQGIGVLEAAPDATFGNGVLVEAVNEGGGRGIRIFDGLSVQLAHVMVLHRYRPKLLERLDAMVTERVKSARSTRASIGKGTVVRKVPHITDVAIGAGARVIGAAYLRNGTILSEEGAPTSVGSGVTARDFVIGEGSTVNDGAVLERCFVGQGVKIGKLYSAENSLFFANSECFHGEGCSIFAGPYTVSHHKSTLMIAGVFSFFNAGSGSNQSNHMYKLGPIHQGFIERGSKTGSFSYMLWPCRVGPFSVVIGKHMDNFDLAELPFSYIDSGENGHTYVVPGMNLCAVGTLRDGAKWPARDRRTASVKRDLVILDVFSPFTVGRMVAGEKLCRRLYAETPREIEEVSCSGAMVRRRLLRTGAKTYATGVEAYLLDAVIGRVEAALESARSLPDVQASLGEEEGTVYDAAWVDISGLLTPRARAAGIEDAIENGKLKTLGEVNSAFTEAFEAYAGDEWSWVRRTYADRYGTLPEELSADELASAADSWLRAKTRFIRSVLADAEKEFDELSSIGFGADGPEGAREADFEAVRGTYYTDKFVQQLQGELEAIEKRAIAFRQRLKGL